MPPCFSTEALTPAIVRKILPPQARSKTGYDDIEYRLTQYSGVPRYLSIPHPSAYAQLCLCIYKHWNDIEYTAKNKNSQIRPLIHKDGRLFIMDYYNSETALQRHHRMSFSRRFMVKADISNCFPSIYSHAVPWAAVGFTKAKAHRDNSEWFNELDACIRALKRGETQGIGIGPGTSAIVSEMILARVDEELEKKYSFCRFIDDYRSYCEDEGEAQQFISDLGNALAKYKLHLNVKKTGITALPQSHSPDWKSSLAMLLRGINNLDSNTATSYFS